MWSQPEGAGVICGQNIDGGMWGPPLSTWCPHGLSGLSGRSTDCLQGGSELRHTISKKAAQKLLVLSVARPEPRTVSF